MQQIAGITDLPYWQMMISAGLAFVRGGIATASVGNFSEIGIFNPVGSGITVTLHSAYIFAPAGVSCAMRLLAGGLTTDLGAGQPLVPSFAPGVAHVQSATPPAADGTLISAWHRPTDAQPHQLPVFSWEIGAGVCVLFTTDAVNQAISGEFYWVERPL